MTRTALQRRRAWFQIGFFILFLLAPPLDIFRIDLTQGHAILLGRDWTLGIDAFLDGRTGPVDAALNLFLRGFLPIFGGAALFLWLAWMANARAMVVGFDTRRADACTACDNACDHACPMRLKPRTVKRKMFTCTECAECISACSQVQGGRPERGLLRWVAGEAALPVVTGRPTVSKRVNTR